MSIAHHRQLIDIFAAHCFQRLGQSGSRFYGVQFLQRKHYLGHGQVGPFLSIHIFHFVWRHHTHGATSFFYDEAPLC